MQHLLPAPCVLLLLIYVSFFLLCAARADSSGLDFVDNSSGDLSGDTNGDLSGDPNGDLNGDPSGDLSDPNSAPPGNAAGGPTMYSSGEGPDENESLNMLCQINNVRSQNGLNRLGLSKRLTAAANRQAVYLRNIQQASHTGDGGSTTDQRIRATGFNMKTGEENLAVVDASYSDQMIVDGWMGAPKLKSNIMCPVESFGGFSAKQGPDGRRYAVFILGSEGMNAPPGSIPRCDGSDVPAQLTQGEPDPIPGTDGSNLGGPPSDDGSGEAA